MTRYEKQKVHIGFRFKTAFSEWEVIKKGERDLWIIKDELNMRLPLSEKDIISCMLKYGRW